MKDKGIMQWKAVMLIVMGADRKQSGWLKNWRIDSIKREQQRERKIG